MSNSHNNIRHPISILLWNANGLTNQKQELQAFLTTNSIDILLISEAYITNKSYCNITGYITYQCNHPDGTAHAGSAILIKSNIKHSSVPPYQNESFQAANIRITLNNIPTTVLSVYCPSRSKLKTSDFYLYFLTLGNNYIAGGHFNSKQPSWRSRITNTRGLALNKAPTIIAPPNPTY